MRELFAFFSPFYLWLIAATGFAIFQILNPGKFNLIIVVGGCLAAALSALYVSVLFQLLYFLGGCGLCFFVNRQMLGRKDKKSASNPDNLIQQIGYVLETVTPESGYVQVGENRWLARNQPTNAAPIEIGKPITVIAIEGNTLVVEAQNTKA